MIKEGERGKGDGGRGVGDVSSTKLFNRCTASFVTARLIVVGSRLNNMRVVDMSTVHSSKTQDCVTLSHHAGVQLDLVCMHNLKDFSSALKASTGKLYSPSYS